MKIAIHVADLDHQRIDGTRVYMLNVLKHLGALAPQDEFILYHRGQFNEQLTPPDFPNYTVKKITFPFLWTQIIFAWHIFWDQPDVLWMPVGNIPFFHRRNLKIVVTVHDLAFKYFAKHFKRQDLNKLNFLYGMAIKKSDRIIAISQSTKKDILKFFPNVEENKIHVVHHGFDAELFSSVISQEESDKILNSYKLKAKSYLLYVGAIQPRKNLLVLIESFEKLHKENNDLKLVLAGERAWMWKPIIEKIQSSSAKQNIVTPGRVPFRELPALFANAAVFVFPPLYEGFGIPVLEAFASGTPVVAADNSSLPEVGGDAALYFKSESAQDLYEKIKQALENEMLRSNLVSKGRARSREFSWQKCASETHGTLVRW